ncbi:MAG: hypothetical protein ACOC9T_02425, partial [Myxococcota bacterium]
MRHCILRSFLVWLASACALTVGCDGGDGGVTFTNPLTDPTEGPPAGNPAGHCAVPAEAAPVDTSNPDTVVGDGSPESCTGDAFVEA